MEQLAQILKKKKKEYDFSGFQGLCSQINVLHRLTKVFSSYCPGKEYFFYLLNCYERSSLSITLNHL